MLPSKCLKSNLCVSYLERDLEESVVEPAHRRRHAVFTLPGSLDCRPNERYGATPGGWMAWEGRGVMNPLPLE
jgi:hypothetical protein